MEIEFTLALSTIDSEKEAKKIAKALIEENLAACVNILPKVTSIYKWQEEICEESEFLMIIKTQEERVEELKAIFSEIHPYDVPELIFLPITDGLTDYLDWIANNTK